MRTHHIRTSQTQISLMGGLLAVLYMLFVLPCSAWGQDINLKDFLPLEVGIIGSTNWMSQILRCRIIIPSE